MAKKTIVDKIVVGTPIGRTVNIAFDSADVIGIVDSDYIQARQVDLQRDSAFVTTIVDAPYVQSKQTPQDFAYSSLTGAPTSLSSFTNDPNFIAATDIPTTVDSDYVQSRVTLDGAGLDSSDVTSIINATFESPITLTDLETTQTVIFNNLPNTDPLNAGQLWRDSSMGSVLRVSTGTVINIDVLTF